MTLQTRLLDPFLPVRDSDALRARIRSAGPYALYVTGPKEEGLGAGLTRRHDAALAWFERQMARGDLEPLDVLAARTNLFRGTWIERGESRFAGARALALHPALSREARELLGMELVEPYMLYANLLLPGQELAVHHDTPEFVGLDKTNTPEWFLVVCGRSGLFERSRIRVASAVLFFEGDGDLVTFPDGLDVPPVRVPPTPNTAIVLDADELVHGVARVGGGGHAAPPVEIGMELAWEGEQWILRRGDAEIARYEPGQVRVSMQWKAWVFKDEAEREFKQSGAVALTVEGAMKVLTEDLARQGLLPDGEIDDIDLALLLMRSYIELPTS
jgi:hypothetical protein